MRAILPILQRHSLWPLYALALGALVLLPSLGRDGLWEPQEIEIADRARQRIAPADQPSATSGEAQKPKRRSTAQRKRAGESWEFTDRVIATSMDRAGTDERGARLLLALLGLLCVALAFGLGVRVASPRAGLIAALVLLSLPLFLSQARQLMSDLGVVAGNAMVVTGAIGIAWPRKQVRFWPYRNAPGRGWIYALDLALIAGGAWMSWDAGGALWGVLVPFGAVALAAAGTEWGLWRDRPAPARPQGDATVMIAGLALGIVGLGAAIAAELGAPALPAIARYGPLLAGVALFAVGLWPRSARPATAVGAAPVSPRRIAWLAVVAVVTAAVAIGALYVVFSHAFDLRDPVPGERELFRTSAVPTESYVEALGGIWRRTDDLAATFDVSFERIALGLFPWVGLAPLALIHLALGRRPGRRVFVGYVLLAWAMLAWIVGAMMARKVAPVSFSALIAVAVAVGVWLDDLICARDQADATVHSDADARKHFGLSLRQPLVALVALCAALAVARDVVAFPDKATSLMSLSKKVTYPKGTSFLGLELTSWMVLAAVVFGVCLGAGLWLWTCRRSDTRPSVPGVQYAGRWGIQVAVALGLVFALFWVHGWLGPLSSRLSSKQVFALYHELADSGEPLGMLGNYGSGPEYYAGGKLEKLKSRNALVEFLDNRDRRVFALTPSGDLCAIHRAIKGRYDYYVLDGTNAKFHLLSNRLEDGEHNENPLAGMIVHTRPDDAIEQPLKVDFDGRIELIGVTAPPVVERGSPFRVTLVFKVLKPVGGSWRVFAHFDRGRARFQGDHPPIKGTCATSYWQAGDYVIDTFTVTAGGVSFPKGTYELWLGFFKGQFGSFKNMPVRSIGPTHGGLVHRDSKDRVRIARIKLD